MTFLDPDLTVDQVLQVFRQGGAVFAQIGGIGTVWFLGAVAGRGGL